MRTHLIKKQTIVDFILKYRNSKTSFDIWIRLLKGADWENVNDIKKTFNSADFIGKGTNRIVFNIGGNNYRMICSYYFGSRNVHLYINWIGSHAEYDKICKAEQQYTINKY